MFLKNVAVQYLHGVKYTVRSWVSDTQTTSSARFVRSLNAASLVIAAAIGLLFAASSAARAELGRAPPGPAQPPPKGPPGPPRHSAIGHARHTRHSSEARP